MVTLAGDPDDEPATSPPRPDVFILRHLTWPEVHAATLGLAAGVLVALSFVYGGLLGRALGALVGVLVALVVLLDVPAQSRAGELLGRETWYFLAVFTVSAVGTGQAIS